MEAPHRTGAAGRPPATSAAQLEGVALQLFARDGYEATTVDDIAAAAGIGRRTFFRYYASKNDVVWGDFSNGLRNLDTWLRESDPCLPLVRALTDAVVRFNSLPDSAVPAHRQRMSLILKVPALQAHSTLQYATWRDVVAGFAARRLGVAANSLQPQLVAHGALAAAVTAYEQWLADERGDLSELLRRCFALLDQGFGRLEA